MISTQPRQTINVFNAMRLCPHCKQQYVKTLRKQPVTVCCQSNHIWHWCAKHQVVVLGQPASRTGCTCVKYDEDRTT